MAKIIQGTHVAGTWLNAVNYLVASDGQARNLLLEISAPSTLGEGDRELIKTVDNALRRHFDLSVNTVAGTIFPYGLYLKHGRPAFYEIFLKTMKRAKKPHTWGTYAVRMMARRGRDPLKPVNPLDQIIEKLKRATTVGAGYQAVYELGVVEPSIDLDDDDSRVGFELPTFDVARDGSMVMNMPCLSHLSFKLTGKDTVDLTVMYRSHYYLQRALGNFIGLGQLLKFVATESGLKVGTLTCLSTHAVLDYPSWGGKGSTTDMLKQINAPAA